MTYRRAALLTRLHSWNLWKANFRTYNSDWRHAFWLEFVGTKKQSKDFPLCCQTNFTWDRVCVLVLVMFVSSGIPASYLTCRSGIAQVKLVSFRYLLVPRWDKKSPNVWTFSSIATLYILMHHLLSVPSQKNSRKKPRNNQNFTVIFLKNCPKLLKVTNFLWYKPKPSSW